ncbi:hypothetical protein Dsin_023999 [Dipteronia sinensis]|uniref:Uncharacterized protein n=1 Tax=Dipteronia sinensis TaxID=43782 RepID=A0AAE0A4N5_9ROSI|nr:hypothetical protein Dsin_023999 [Dipteronia sinensis]
MENKELMLEAIGGWKGCKVGSSKSRILKAKMKATKLYIKKWLSLNKNQLSSTEQLEDSLAKLDNKAELAGWIDCLRESRLKLLLKLWTNIRKEEQSWRQKSRVKWLKEGDRNTKFFHFLVNDRRRRNLIRDISFDGVVLTDPNLIRQRVFDSFKKHYENVSWLRPKIGDLSLKRLTECERINLEQPFSLEEVWEAVESCD